MCIVGCPQHFHRVWVAEREVGEKTTTSGPGTSEASGVVSSTVSTEPNIDDGSSSWDEADLEEIDSLITGSHFGGSSDDKCLYLFFLIHFISQT